MVAGRATVDQATITGESMPVDVVEGSRVFAATIASGGSLRVRTERVGTDTTFGRVIRMVEEAETHRADVQRLADRVAGWYLPVVVALAAVTFVVSRNLSSVVAVLVVACACSFALATPIAILASVGAAARRGLLIKGRPAYEVNVQLAMKLGQDMVELPGGHLGCVSRPAQFAGELVRALEARSLEEQEP